MDNGSLWSSLVDVYDAGGKSPAGHRIDSCEKYNLKTRSWEDCEHNLPSTLNVDHASVAVSRDESEAIIFGATSHFTTYMIHGYMVIVFCEINGFRIIDETQFSSKIECFTKHHISIVDLSFNR